MSMTQEQLAAWRLDNPRNELALAAIAAWVNCAPERLPKEMRAHTCPATKAAWARVGEAVNASAIARAERAEAEVHRLRSAIAAKGGTEHAPTQDAYDAACRAIEKHRERAERAEAALAVAEDALRVIALSVLSLSAAADAENRRHAGFVLAKIAALKGGAQ